MQALELYQEWLSEPFYDTQTKGELRSIAGNTAEIEDRFYRDLEFAPAACADAWAPVRIV